MIFGKISYLNLLPFEVFIKKTPLCHPLFYATKQGVPAHINRLFSHRRIQAAFISSITACREHQTCVGIVARSEVLSVLVCQGVTQNDPASQTSNALAKLLGLKGKIMIGDRALEHYYVVGEGIDLGKVWQEKTGLPFVFGVLCANSHKHYITRVAKKFFREKVFISHFLLSHAAQDKGLTPHQLRYYFTKISYAIDPKAKKGLALFLRNSRFIKNKNL